MNSRILNFFNVKLDAFIVFVSVVVVIMFIALFFLLLDYLKMRKRYVEFMTGESGKSLEYTIYKRFREIDKLKDIVIDIAFVPLDPRQENQYACVMYYVMKHTHTKYVFPMHMWGHYEVYEKLMNNPQAESYKEHVMHVKVPGQVFELP